MTEEPIGRQEHGTEHNARSVVEIGQSNTGPRIELRGSQIDRLLHTRHSFQRPLSMAIRARTFVVLVVHQLSGKRLTRTGSCTCRSRWKCRFSHICLFRAVGGVEAYIWQSSCTRRNHHV